ncbi:5'/3'-nucleotidase SurE [Arundinibacter roseus]|uniref:5'-nucleotidase SurE n=1 Tax=Arundinibacter roseus TaxID=2070510 RepID=A0A4V2XAB2_9BACT|nr:5'/3'-nucleotidase SurE [Arundinibacter roseus]TDB66985.1 5'/3'-nucleotidase SurE [Arundinibacter roseus]
MNLEETIPIDPKRPLILVTNDDGITSLGIRTLVEVMLKLGNVVVVAPNSPQSGMGHAITIGEPLRLYSTELFAEVDEYECSGTPADCVKLAKHYVLKDRAPDLVVSGINHGSNSSISVLYSGTMSAAIEAAIEGIPAIGFSLCDYREQANFEHVKEYVYSITKMALENGIPKGVALNVNFPALSDVPIKGVKICRQANAKWQEKFDYRKDPYGRGYLWMSGDFVNFDHDKEDTDEWALANNYVSVVPCQYDLTSYPALESIAHWVNQEVV